jgi:hypothetical protein
MAYRGSRTAAAADDISWVGFFSGFQLCCNCSSTDLDLFRSGRPRGHPGTSDQLARSLVRSTVVQSTASANRLQLSAATAAELLSAAASATTAVLQSVLAARVQQ